ncbi:unnamed protein product, partial [Phaeothamnion confervicola]
MPERRRSFSLRRTIGRSALCLSCALAASSGGLGSNCDPLAVIEASKALLLSNYRDSFEGTVPWPDATHFSSTDALLAAWASAHFDQVKAQQIFGSVLRGQWRNGLMPSARFTLGSKATWTPGTLLPGPGSFLWGSSSSGGGGGGGGGGEGTYNTTTLAALPLHALVALQIFDLSERDAPARLWLQDIFQPLFHWHQHLHTARNHAPTGLVLALHPWETALPPDATLWPQLLAAASSAAAAAAANGTWAPPEVPTEVSSLPEFPGKDVFESSLYLLQCLSGSATGDQSITAGASPTTAEACSETKGGQCPFAMLDVQFNAALLRSDQALLEIAMLLEQTRSTWQSRIYTPEQYAQMQAWAAATDSALGALWDADRAAFRGRFWVDTGGDAAARDWNSSADVPASAADFSALLPVGKVAAAAADRLIFKLLMAPPLAKDSFRCARYPIVEEPCNTGDGCGVNAGGSERVWLLHNLLAQRALQRQAERALTHWLTNSTVALICQSGVVGAAAGVGAPEAPAVAATPPHATASADVSGAVSAAEWTANHPLRAERLASDTGSSAGAAAGGPCASCTFSRVFDGITGAAVVDAQGGNTTLAAAIAILLLLSDGPEVLESYPPISHAVTFAVMLVELLFSFSIGVSCFVISLNLVRKLQKDDPGAVLFAERSTGGWRRQGSSDDASESSSIGDDKRAAEGARRGGGEGGGGGARGHAVGGGQGGEDYGDEGSDSSGGHDG